MSSYPRRLFPMVVLWAALGCPACSLLLDTNTSQCQHDSDCARFGSTLCDPVQHLCATAPQDGGSSEVETSCYAQSGCYQCTPVDNQELLSACTDSVCIPFDNSRLTNLGPDGSLKPLP